MTKDPFVIRHSEESMPTYDYVCDACGHKFEEMQSFKADPLTTCRSATRTSAPLFARAAILFKGGGFWTDYRSDSYKTRKRPRRPQNPPKPLNDAVEWIDPAAPTTSPAKPDGPAKKQRSEKVRSLGRSDDE
jgi:putative FmdB family regulatory protein